MTLLKIHSIYSALEGEGVHIGTPTTLVRFQGCDEKCKNCDTPDSWNKKHGSPYTVEMVMEEVQSLPAKRVSITGGDIMLQPQGLYKLIFALQDQQYLVNLELTGQEYYNFIQFNSLLTYLSIDIKPPSTGVTPNIAAIQKHLTDSVRGRQFKIVVADEVDLEFALSTFAALAKVHPYENYVITPCYTTKQDSFDYSFIETIIDQVILSKLPIRVILQQHKVIFGSKAKLV